MARPAAGITRQRGQFAFAVTAANVFFVLMSRAMPTTISSSGAVPAVKLLLSKIDRDCVADFDCGGLVVHRHAATCTGQVGVDAATPSRFQTRRGRELQPLVCDFEMGGAFPGGGTDGLHDSPLEQSGFEPLVPAHEGTGLSSPPLLRCENRLHGREGAVAPG